MVLPEEVVPGSTSGHIAHHQELHEMQGVLRTDLSQGAHHHDLHHELLRIWYNAGNAGSPLSALPRRSTSGYGAAHAAHHEAIHVWANALPTDWLTAFNSRDMSGTQPARDTSEPIGQIQAWYSANTGHDPALSYEVLGAGTWTINLAWLQAREGNGRVSFSGGRWFVERYETPGIIRVAINNITLTNIYQNSAGSLYGFQSRTADGNATGVVLENSTLAGNAANDNGAALNFPDARNVDQIILRNCDISGYRAGLYCFGGITAEYCWVHDLHFSPGSHNTGASMRAGNNHLYRCLIADGNSSAISWYPEYGPYTNNIAEENVLRLANADTGPEVILAEGRAFSVVSGGDTRILQNNLFYRGGNRGEGGGIGGYMAGFTTISGNIDRLGTAVD